MGDVAMTLGATAGALVSSGVIWAKGLRPLFRLLRRIGEVHELIIEELPTFMSDTTRFMDTTKQWQMNADDVLKQLQPNSGSSMFDRVKTIEEQMPTLVDLAAVPDVTPTVGP